MLNGFMRSMLAWRHAARVPLGCAWGAPTQARKAAGKHDEGSGRLSLSDGQSHLRKGSRVSHSYSVSHSLRIEERDFLAARIFSINADSLRNQTSGASGFGGGAATRGERGGTRKVESACLPRDKLRAAMYDPAASQPAKPASVRLAADHFLGWGAARTGAHLAPRSRLLALESNCLYLNQT